MKPSWYCGVDPGVKGAIAFYTTDVFPQLHIFDFITFKKGSSSNTYHLGEHKTQIDLHATWCIVQKFIDEKGPVKLVLLETPNSLPSDGHVGAFNFGKACGQIEGILGALGLKVIPIVPAVWKPHLGLSSVKQKSIDKALEVFKDIDGAKDYFTHKKHNDRAEAALLAWHCRLKFGGK